MTIKINQTKLTIILWLMAVERKVIYAVRKWKTFGSFPTPDVFEKCVKQTININSSKWPNNSIAE